MGQGVAPGRLRRRERLAVGIAMAWVALTTVAFGHWLAGWVAPRPVGLAASYFANEAWRGTPLVEERAASPTLEAVERGSIPVSSHHFSARFEGWLAIADPGRYELATSFDDLLVVSIDDHRVVPVTGEEGDRSAKVHLDLGRGAHRLSIRYANLGGDGRLALSIARAGLAPPWHVPPSFRPPERRPRVAFGSVLIERLARSWAWASIAGLAAVVALTWQRQGALAEALARHPHVTRVMAAAPLHVAAASAIAIAVFFTDLGARSVARHDEDTHTRVALETADARQWWPLVYHGEPYARKPPLKLWISAATFRWLGTSEWWVRAWDAGFAVLTVVATYALARRERGAGAALAAAAVLVTCDGYVFHHGARDGVQDSAMILGFTVALAVGSRIPLTSRGALATAAALTATSLTKPAMGLVPLAILMLHRVATGNRRELLRSPFVATCAAAVAAPLAWQLAGWLSIPGFVETSVGEQIVGRIAGTSEPWHAEPWWYYFPTQLTSLVGWWPVVLVALPSEAWRAFRRHGGDGFARLLLVWPAVVFGAATLVSLKLPWYVYPAYPAFAIAIGSLVNATIGALGRRVGARRPALAALAALALAAFLGVRVADTVERARAPRMPLVVERWVTFLGEPERASWRLIGLGIDPALDFDDAAFYYLHRLRDRMEHVATAEALAAALAREPARPTMVLVSPRATAPAALAESAAARFTLPMPYGHALEVLGFGPLDGARVPLARP